MKYRHTRIIAIGIAAVLETAGMSDAFAQDHQAIINYIRNFLPPAWNFVILPPSDRFLPSVGDPAFESVQDRETNLLWERAPDATTRSWDEANTHCTNRVVRIGTLLGAPRKGWRLPTVQEFMSLIDPEQNSPALPPGHPFTVGVGGQWWTATTVPVQNSMSQRDVSAWRVSLLDGIGSIAEKGVGELSNVFLVWCVRSPFPTRSE